MPALLPTPPSIPRILSKVSTPLQLSVWAAELCEHPDQEYVKYLLKGIAQGFRIGFDYRSCHCRSAKQNMHSASEHPEPIEAYLQKECDRGTIVGPLRQEIAGLQVSRFGVIPKPHQPGKWRLITDLSAPAGHSVNDGISPLLCSLSYASTDDAVRRLQALGHGALLAKFDLASAYRMVPVHPHDRQLLGMRWKGQVYVDCALPFGLRSAPKIFTALADALLWMMGSHGVREALHYLDDYLILAPRDSDKCNLALHTSLQLCKRLGVPIAPQKVEGPATKLNLFRHTF